MIGLDTNVLVRHLAADDPVQSPIARQLVDSLTPAQPGFISLVTLVETHWVLRQAYRYKVDVINRAVAALVDAAEFVVDEADLVRSCLIKAAETGRELPDILIAERGARLGCRTTYTFDRQASTLPGMELLTS